MANVGLQVNEGVANGVTPFVEASISNIGILMERQRGIPNLPTLVTSLQEDIVAFGAGSTGQFGALVMNQLFTNAGKNGAVVYGVRIVGSGAVAATGNVLANSLTSTLTDAQVSASSVSAGQVDSFTPAVVAIGCTYRIFIGDYYISFVATAATVANVVAGLLAALVADTAANPASPFNTNGIVGANQATYLQLTGAVGLPITYSTQVLSTNNIITLSAGQQGYADPGTWGNNLVAYLYPIGDPNGLANAYLLQTYLNGSNVESLSASTLASLVSTINQNSKYLYATAVNTALALTDVQIVTFTGGTDVTPVEANFYPNYSVPGAPTGLAVLDGLNVQIIANTEFHTLTMANQGKAYAIGRSNGGIYLANLPYLATDSTVASFAALLQDNNADTRHIATYDLWVQTQDSNGNNVWIPGIGTVIGSGYVNVPALNNNLPWIPPAGVDSAFTNVTAISPSGLSQSKINLYVQRYTTNVAVYLPGYGFYLASSRTCSTNPLYMSVHISRMTDWLIATMYANLAFAVQKPNTIDLRRQIVTALTVFFRGIYANGGLENSVPFTTAFQVVCDKTNNPGTQDRKLLNATIQWIPTECSEAVVVSLNRNDGILSLQTN